MIDIGSGPAFFPLGPAAPAPQYSHPNFAHAYGYAHEQGDRYGDRRGQQHAAAYTYFPEVSASLVGVKMAEEEVGAGDAPGMMIPLPIPSSQQQPQALAAVTINGELPPGLQDGSAVALAVNVARWDGTHQGQGYEFAGGGEGRRCDSSVPTTWHSHPPTPSAQGPPAPSVTASNGFAYSHAHTAPTVSHSHSKRPSPTGQHFSTDGVRNHINHIHQQANSDYSNNSGDSTSAGSTSPPMGTFVAHDYPSYQFMTDNTWSSSPLFNPSGAPISAPAPFADIDSLTASMSTPGHSPHSSSAAYHQPAAGQAPQGSSEWPYLPSSSPSTVATDSSRIRPSHSSTSSPPSASVGSGSRSGQSVSPTAPTGQFPPTSSSGPESAEDPAHPRIPIACSTCRKRKTKCDGTRPQCANCRRRGDECEYELVPKRRGPDRKPGTRVRSVFSKRLAMERGWIPPVVEKKRRRREDAKAAVERQAVRLSVFGDGGGDPKEERPVIKMEWDPSAELFPLSAEPPMRPVKAEPTQLQITPQSAYISELSDFSDDGWTQLQIDEEGEAGLVRQPSVDFARKTWWDNLLDMYTGSRETSYKQIRNDIAYVFSLSPYFISFINVPLFWQTFHSPQKRDSFQPSLILSFLALATFMRSSEVGMGLPGRQRALQIAEIARAYYQSSIDSGWIGPGLAQAAFMLTLFEMCPHPQYSSQRLASSFWTLDGMLAALGLPGMDAHDDDAAIFAPGFVPSLSQHAHGLSHTPPAPRISISGHDPKVPECSCPKFSLIASSDSAQRVTPLWAETPAWDPDWSEAETKKEECRRLVWNSLNLMSGHTSMTLAAGQGAADYQCTRPENFALLFPGETLLRSERWRGLFGGQHPRDSIWGVYGRLALLYGACWRYFSPHSSASSSRPLSAGGGGSAMAHATYPPVPDWLMQPPRTESDKAEFAYRAYVETLELEEILNQHACAGERSTLFQGREFLFKIRVIISQDYTKHFPFPETGIDLTFHKRKAEQWLTHQMNLAQRLMGGLNAVTGMNANDLRLRPFLLWYFTLQSQRCLQFHTIDPSLTVALDVADAWMMPVDYLVQIWPCANMEPYFDDLRQKILEARLAAGMTPFLPRGKPMEFVNPMLSASAVVVE